MITIIDTKTKTPLFTEATWADSFLQRAWGLLGRDSLSDQQALIFKRAGCIHTFFMRIPIDIIFMDREMSIIRIAPNTAPFKFVCCWKAVYTIEVNAGLSITKALYEGQNLTFIQP